MSQEGGAVDDVELLCEDSHGTPPLQVVLKCPKTATWSHVCGSCRHVTLLCAPCHITRTVVALWNPHVCVCGSTGTPEVSPLHPEGSS